METIHFQGNEGIVNWQGVSFEMNQEYSHFMQNDVASRLNDQPGNDEFNAHLRGLASTGFAQNSLNAILSANVPEERDWAVGEAFAESWLTKKYGAVWPWNTVRDKRTPKASLPGADLIGFVEINNQTRLLIGEVKTSSDKDTPPNVMNGQHGMIHQLEKLVTDLSLISQLLQWLQPRCKNTVYQNQFNAAVILLLNSNNKSIAIFGILIRDTQPHEKDLSVRAKALAKSVEEPTECQLQALYLPHPIASLPDLIISGESS